MLSIRQAGGATEDDVLPVPVWLGEDIPYTPCLGRVGVETEG